MSDPIHHGADVRELAELRAENDLLRVQLAYADGAELRAQVLATAKELTDIRTRGEEMHETILQMAKAQKRFIALLADVSYDYEHEWPGEDEATAAHRTGMLKRMTEAAR